MEKKDFLHDFLQNYKDNRDLNDRLHEKLLEKNNLAEWTRLLKERSQKMRFIYGETEEMLATIRDYLDEILTDNDAEMLFDVIMDLYYCGYDDFEIMSTIANKLISYYEMRNDLDHRVFLYHLMGFETTEFYYRTMGDAGLGVAIDYYQRVISLRAHYVEVTDPRIRRCFFTAYSNLIAPLTEICSFLQDSVYDYYYAVLDLYNNPAVQTLDGDKPFLPLVMAKINEDILYSEAYVDTLKERQRGQFIKIAEQAKRELDLGKREDSSGAVMRAYHKARILSGRMNVREVVEEQIDLIADNLRFPNYSDPDNEDRELEIFFNFHDTGLSILKYLKDSEFTPAERREYLERFFNKVTHVHQTAPYHFFTSRLNSASAEWFKAVEPFMDSLEEKRNYLSKIIISRQPITYLHSLMVVQIAQAITNVYLWTNPEEFIGILGCNDVDDVKKKVEEIKKYVCDCAMLHDIGKCLITDVINQQWRRLCGEEQDLIRLHPEKGLMLVNEDPMFAPYFDVIVGHHKCYDGKGGYPVAFDNTKSPIKIIIDIITIADSIDAGTDIYCRNYARGKTFQELLQELSDRAGTRYHPGIVKLLNDNTGLQSHLEYITGEGRIETYFAAFREIISL